MKISLLRTLAVITSFAVAEANVGDDKSSHLLRGSASTDRNLLYVQKEFNNMRCTKTKIDIQVCFKTDDWPYENTLRIQNRRGVEGFAMGSFQVKREMHCEVVACCPGEVRYHGVCCVSIENCRYHCLRL